MFVLFRDTTHLEIEPFTLLGSALVWFLTLIITSPPETLTSVLWASRLWVRLLQSPSPNIHFQTHTPIHSQTHSLSHWHSKPLTHTPHSVCMWTSNITCLRSPAFVSGCAEAFPCQCLWVSLGIHCVLSSVCGAGLVCSAAQEGKRAHTLRCPGYQNYLNLSWPPPPLQNHWDCDYIWPNILGLVFFFLDGQPHTCANPVVWPQPYYHTLCACTLIVE